MKSNLPKVAVAYLTWPHYRAGIGQAMRGSSCYSYHLVGSDENISPSIPIWEGWRNGPHTVAPLVPLPWGWWQRRIVPLAFDSSVDAIVLMALPGALSHWCCAALCAVTGKPVLVWTHGWTRIDSVQTTIAKRLLYSLPRALLLYSKRAKMLGIRAGFSASKLFAVGNSLDHRAQRGIRESMTDEEVEKSVPEALRELPYVICTARLTRACQLGLLCDAMVLLKGEGIALAGLLVGEGPERMALEEQFAAAGVQAIFTGAVYDERSLASWICRAEMTVSPGKVGLTALHSLTYGTPVVSHSDLDRQMPEAETIIPGVTGELFEYGSAEDLARAIQRQLNRNRLSRAEVAEQCMEAVKNGFTPSVQLFKIEEALDAILGRPEATSGESVSPGPRNPKSQSP